MSPRPPGRDSRPATPPGQPAPARPPDHSSERRDAVAEVIDSARLGDTRKIHRFIDSTYAELRHYATALMNNESTAHTLQPTALVNEAVRILIERRVPLHDDRAANFRLITRLMRRILIDHARAKKSDKRGGKLRRIELADDLIARELEPDLVLDIDLQLKRLKAEQPELHQVFCARFYGGLTHAQIAAIVGVSERTIIRDWQAACAILQPRLDAASSAVG